MKKQLRDLFLDDTFLDLRSKLHNKIKIEYDSSMLCKVAENMIIISVIYGTESDFILNVQNKLLKVLQKIHKIKRTSL